MVHVSDPWSGLEPQKMRAILQPLDVCWWIAGGWAIDLFLGRITRRHADLDVACYRGDARAFLRLPGWDCYGAMDGRLLDLDPHGSLPPDLHSLWVRRTSTRLWGFQVMIERRTESTWHFRRNPTIALDADQLWWTNAEGLRVIRPEVQLLYKAKDPRPHDEADFAATTAALDASALRWLIRSLDAVHPGHAWSERLKAGPVV